MENTKPDGGPVSAVYIPERRVGNGPIERDIVQVGISLRDHFAGLAMQAMIREYFNLNGPSFGDDADKGLFRNVPGHSYKMADAMIAERSK